MRLVYFDEVKHHQGRQPYYWLAGLIVDAETVKRVDTELAALSNTVFGTPTLERRTEFHAVEIYGRRGIFSGSAWTEWAPRIDLFKKLIEVIDRHDEIGKVVVRLNPDLMVAHVDNEQLAKTAFMYFLERVQMFLGPKEELGLLIGDRENDNVSRIAAEALSRYRDQGTHYAYGTSLKWLIDTVHFTDSHLSRMLQMADLFVWLEQMASRPASNPGSAELRRFLREETQILSPHRYKYWPTENSWALQ